MIVCIYFGITVSLNDYSKGEQILTFLTMELFSLCLLTWRPFSAFLISGISFLYFYFRIDQMIAVNTGTPGTTIATKINFFFMWISTMMVCIANYNSIRIQAHKAENLQEENTYLSKLSIEDELTGIHNMVYFRSEAEKLLNYVTTDKESIVFLFFDIENFKSYNEKYGFHAGNDLLVKIAHMIDDAFSSSLVSRFSDDHFVVLTSIEGAKNIIGQLSGEVKKLQKEVHLELKCGAYKPVGDEADVSLACDRARFACNSIKKHYDRTLRLYDKSLECYKKALAIAKNNGLRTTYNQVCMSMSGVLDVMGKHKEALNYAKKGFVTADSAVLVSSQIALASCYLSNDSIEQARLILESVVCDSSDFSGQYLVNRYLANVCHQKKAYSIEAEYVDSAFSSLEKLYYQAMDVKDNYYQDNVRKELKKEQMQRIHERRTWLFGFIILVLFIITISLVCLYKYKQAENRRKRREELLRLRYEASEQRRKEKEKESVLPRTPPFFWFQ